MRGVVPAGQDDAFGQQAALLLDGLRVVEGVKGHIGRVWLGGGDGLLGRLPHLGIRLRLYLIPLFLAELAGHEVGVQGGERVAGAFFRPLRLIFICLVVHAGVPRQAWHCQAQQGGAVASPHMADGRLHEVGRFCWLCAAPIPNGQATKAGQIGRNVAPRRLQRRFDRDGVAVVFDEEQHGQLQGGGHR